MNRPTLQVIFRGRWYVPATGGRTVLRALIVEDEPSLCRSLRATVSAFGFTDVADVPAGNDAIEVAATTDPNLIVLDVDLMGSRGLQLIPALLAVAPSCALVVLSSFDSLRFAALEAGAFAVVGKSDLRELQRELARMPGGSGRGPASTGSP